MIGINVSRMFNPSSPVLSSVASPLANGLVAYFKFDESSGVSASDSSGNGNTGTWNGTLGSQWGSGKINNGGAFNGTNNYLTIPYSATLEPSRLSISTWVNLSNVSVRHDIIAHICSAASSNASYLLTVGLSAGQVSGYFQNGTTSVNIDSVQTIGAGSSVHIVLTYDGVTAIIYINGSLDKSSTLNQALFYSGSHLTTIGASLNNSDLSPAQFLVGNNDETGIWSRILSSSEVSQLYNSGLGLQYPF